MGIEVYPGLPLPSCYLMTMAGKGVATGDMGISAEGEQKDSTYAGATRKYALR